MDDQGQKWSVSYGFVTPETEYTPTYTPTPTPTPKPKPTPLPKMIANYCTVSKVEIGECTTVDFEEEILRGINIHERNIVEEKLREIFDTRKNSDDIVCFSILIEPEDLIEIVEKTLGNRNSECIKIKRKINRIMSVHNFYISLGF